MITVGSSDPECIQQHTIMVGTSDPCVYRNMIKVGIVVV